MTKKALLLQTLLIFALQILMAVTLKSEVEPETFNDSFVDMLGMICANTVLYHSLLHTYHFDYEGRNKYMFVVGLGMIGLGICTDLPIGYIVAAVIVTFAISIVSSNNQKKGRQ